MTLLARWLERELGERGLSLRAAAVASGVSIATLSDVLRKGHIPGTETLFKLADCFGAPRDQVLSLAAGLPWSRPEGEGRTAEGPGAGDPGDDFLIQQLIEEFRQVPDEWKQEALAQMSLFRRLAQRPAVRIVGEEAHGRRVQRQPEGGGPGAAAGDQEEGGGR